MEEAAGLGDWEGDGRLDKGAIGKETGDWIRGGKKKKRKKKKRREKKKEKEKRREKKKRVI